MRSKYISSAEGPLWRSSLAQRKLLFSRNLVNIVLKDHLNDVDFSVESGHLGKNPNAVMYVPVGPECPLNRLYVERSRWLFRKGLAPQDFQREPEKEVNFEGRATWKDLNEEAKRQLGENKELYEERCDKHSH